MKYYPTTPQDWFNYIAQGVASNALIQYVVQCKQIIDYETLKQAVHNSIVAEPLLGCRLSLAHPVPRWVPEEYKIQDICCLRETEDIEQEIQHDLSQEIKISKQSPVMVFLITNQVSNVVVIKIHHAACDGAGSQYYLTLLADCYTKIQEKTPFFYSAQPPKRTTSALYRALGVDEIEEYFEPEKIDLTSSWGFIANRERGQTNTFSYKSKSFEKIQLTQIKKYSKRNDITISTLFISAYFFGLLHVLHPHSGQFKEVQITSDLRKYLPENSNHKICNLSAVFNITLPRIFQNLHELVVQATTATEKANKIENIIHGTIANDLCLQSGFSSCVDMFHAEWKNILKTGHCSPMLSNLGVLAPDNIRFGDSAIDEISFIPPAFYTPAFMLGVSTFKNKVSLSASYYTPDIQPASVENLLERIEYFFMTLMD
ncbi:hypothetical protein JWJ90_19360 [Desulfobulbus rhabdoformis]|uniref:hypothetical protein n=1 Tax=Desulfobulbus rhabdoformis TaxID=34032 RepID=UPI0019659A39|nr:hypothetical protein [Desulfobulbus rhabdoformis]MBM9616431.1 hypothetical protein [Desulfobulbus rhabdoformis]